MTISHNPYQAGRSQGLSSCRENERPWERSCFNRDHVVLIVVSSTD